MSSSCYWCSPHPADVLLTLLMFSCNWCSYGFSCSPHAAGFPFSLMTFSTCCWCSLHATGFPLTLLMFSFLMHLSSTNPDLCRTQQNSKHLSENKREQQLLTWQNKLYIIDVGRWLCGQHSTLLFVLVLCVSQLPRSLGDSLASMCTRVPPLIMHQLPTADMVTVSPGPPGYCKV